MLKKSYIIILICLCCAFLLTYYFFVSPFRRALPISAKNVYVYSRDYGPNKRTYYLKAEISKVEFQNYISKFDLHSWEEDRVLKNHPEYVIWQGEASSPLWWDPKPSIEGTFGYAETEKLIAKYEKGNIYLYYYVD